MHLKLTDLAIRSLPVPGRGQKDYYDISMPGLCLRVSQGGSKVFTFLLRKENKRRRITIGKYGTVTLSEARTAANKILAGASPNPFASMTFETALDLYITHHLSFQSQSHRVAL